MTAFRYIALDKQGKRKKGILEADSPKLIRQQLRELGLVPLDVQAMQSSRKIKQETKKNLSLLSFLKRKSLPIKEVALITRQLATLIAAAIPIEEALQTVAEQTSKEKTKEILLAVRSKVLEGYALACALESYPYAFTTLYCKTVAAGEKSGHLATVLNRLADYIEQQHDMRQRIQQALIYPALMTLISISIVTFLLVYVVPKMVTVYNNTGQALPTLTLILIGISDFISQYGLYLIFLFACFIMVFNYFLKKPTLKIKCHSILLTFPLIGHISRVINTARFTKTFGILLSTGVPVIEALSTASQLITNLLIKKAVSQASLKIREGASIHLALKQTNYFSPMSLHMIASGEKSGQLESMLERTATQQENEVSRLIDTMLSLFEPFITLLMGAIVLFIVLAVLLPIFSLDIMN